MRRFLRITLQSHGYRLVEAATAQEGLMQATTRNPDVVLLDLGLPDLDGLEVTKRLREWTQTPIIVISAREQEQDKVKALDAGADDYLTKPFNAGELLARIRVALRHAARQITDQNEPVFTLRNLRVDLALRQVFVDDKEVHLTPIEYKLLDGAGPACRQGHYPSPAVAGSLGSRSYERGPVSSRLHDAAQA